MSPLSDERNIHEAFNTFREKHLEEVLDTVRKAVLAGDAQKVIMSLAMLLALTVCPAMLGTQEAIRQSQSKNKREEHRARRCNLVVSCCKPSIRSRDINGKLVVLKDQKVRSKNPYLPTGSWRLYITNEVPSYDGTGSDSVFSGHPFSGYFLPYPDSQYEGLVSTISDDPPMLNWIYVDRNTYEVKYGVRAEAQEHLTGPFDCTRQDRRMTLEGWEGFVAVEEFPGIWALYFDRDDDGLTAKVPMGTRVLEIELTRREKKERKPEPDPNQATTLDDMMKQHKAQTAQEEQERQQFAGSEDPQQAAAEQVPASTADVEVGEAPPPVQVTHEAQDPSNIAFERGEEPPSPSAVSGKLSFWSTTRKVEAGDDDASITAASSTLDRTDDLVEAVVELEETGYKKPYVEDEQ
ncbi:hypothetical protein SLS62_004188 [Diatrype stigma]|uniref:Uncharacterized protein n=1 Tax=Diatrype stigma TaxID=117547 RepID=A0AAN9UV28_9PEZI